jgi:hypothetical protein
MGAKENYPNPLVIIILSLGYAFLLLIIILLGIKLYWQSTEIIPIPTQRESQIIYPTYTYYPTNELLPTYPPLPTYTLFITKEPEWIWTTLPFHRISVEIPKDWSILPINHRWESTGSGSKECEDYLIIGPDGKQIITVTFVCSEGEGIGGGCPDNIQIFANLGNNNYLYRLADPENNSYTYGKTTYGEWTWMTPIGKGYWCMSEHPNPYIFQVIGKQYYEITDFSIIDRIMKSLMANSP